MGQIWKQDISAATTASNVVSLANRMTGTDTGSSGLNVGRDISTGSSLLLTLPVNISSTAQVVFLECGYYSFTALSGGTADIFITENTSTITYSRDNLASFLSMRTCCYSTTNLSPGTITYRLSMKSNDFNSQMGPFFMNAYVLNTNNSVSTASTSTIAGALNQSATDITTTVQQPLTVPLLINVYNTSSVYISVFGVTHASNSTSTTTYVILRNTTSTVATSSFSGSAITAKFFSTSESVTAGTYSYYPTVSFTDTGTYMPGFINCLTVG